MRERDDVFLVDKSKLFREGIKRLLAENSFRVCGEAASLDEAMRHIEEEDAGPGLVLLDYLSARADDIESLRRLSAGEGAPKLVVLTSELKLDWLMTSLSVGASGYLLKDMSPDAFIQSLRLILLGERVLPTDLAVLLVSSRLQPRNQIESAMPAQDLSDRETQILRCLLQGDSNKLIAKRLNITEGTVKVHLKGVLKKINVRNRTQAAIWALNKGLIPER